MSALPSSMFTAFIIPVNSSSSSSSLLSSSLSISPSSSSSSLAAIATTSYALRVESGSVWRWIGSFLAILSYLI
jgi:hypothetical protein